MSVILTTIDYVSLPTELLPQAKMHCRIEHNEDDAFLISVIARAIQHFEIKTETKVFAAEYVWTPFDYCTFRGELAARCPISPVRSFKAFLDAVDVSALYSFVTPSTVEGAGPYYFVGARQSGLQVQQLKTGYTDASLIPPGILDNILQITATYYENRELFIPAGQFLNPTAHSTVMAGWWVPKV